MLAYFAAVAAVAALILGFASAHDTGTVSASEETGTSKTPTPVLSPQQATQHFPAQEVAKLRTIAETAASVWG